MLSSKIVLSGALSLLIGTMGTAAAAEGAVMTAASTVVSQQKTQSVSQKAYDLTFVAKPDRKDALTVNGKSVPFYVYENRVYVRHPKAASYESMNLYVPAAYLNGGTINGYTAKTAPIFMPNGVGGYMPGEILEPSETNRREAGPNAVLYALSRGYVVAAPAIRGRTTKDENGTYVGKAPALIVDYKAAVRYLRYNRNRLPAGNTDRIISNGTSAGGALSSLLGATGNNSDYEPYLDEIGAARERDDIFAASVYCPITDLTHADMAYEWIFNGVNEYHQQRGPMGGARTAQTTKTDRPLNAPTESTAVNVMTPQEQAVSQELKAAYPAYLNSLNLESADHKPLTLDANGNGSFKDYIKSVYIASAQKAQSQGVDISKTDWLKFSDGKVVDMDLARYAVSATRLKAAPAFDKLDGSSPENDEFGTENNTPRHFTAFSMSHRTDANAEAPEEVTNLLNPLYSMREKKGTVAPHWRIRHGSLDRDTSLAVPAELALTVQQQNKDVNFEAVWGKGHAGDYDLPELFDWLDKICHA
jgi:acetyl esterase/lipase